MAGLALALGWSASASATAAPVPGAGAGSSAASGGVAGVLLEIDACPAIDEAVLRQLVAIEIGDLLLPPTATARRTAEQRLTIHCEGAQIHLTVAGAANAKPVERSLKTSDFPGDVAARALALAGIEMLAGSSPIVRRRVDARQGIQEGATGNARAPASPASTPPATRGSAASALGAQATTPDEPPSVETEADAESEPEGHAINPPAGDPRSAPVAAGAGEEPLGSAPRPDFLIGLAAVRRSFLVDNGVSGWGATVGFDREIGARWFLRLDLEGDSASRTGPVGEASALLASLGGFFGLRLGRPDLTAVLAAGGRFGIVRFSGAPAGAGFQGDSVLDPWGGPAVTGRILSGAGRLGLSLSVETGVALVAAEGLADRTVAIAVRGIWFSAGAGVWF